MQIPLISIIMSAYNESIDELKASITSVLVQTYYNFEFIIVCDNPQNKDMLSYLNQITDDRVKIIYNDKNMGLVRSLNRALEYVNGDYVARMDADDICYRTRLYDEYNFMNANHCDLVGAYIELIDEANNTIKPEMRFPLTDKRIKRFMRYGSCICHPTWLVRKDVYKRLNGYRDTPHCEDYAFIIRAIREGFVLGNLNKVELKYRIRSSGISKSNTIKQFLLRDYLAGCYSKNNYPSQLDVNQYIESDIFYRQIKMMERYVKSKEYIKSKQISKKLGGLSKIVFNRYFWKDLIEKIILLARER